MVILGSRRINTGDYRYASAANYGDLGIAYRPTLVIIGTLPTLAMVFLGSLKTGDRRFTDTLSYGDSRIASELCPTYLLPTTLHGQ